ncbi:glycosyltransferase family 2 protein [Haloflavibacter putidus]|uniref:Glycosyltransferase family 2 protein n=1 Tax=Haloflavibacter putidus TaxID=2576776 RepID=A0A507ZD12_9FLAO|nr:glycosyltransferase family A protein [Haloflavibacter putidus]TQD33828.1 glycosyltransferase family 2 protein [Haloflavibacter putidus]
MIFNFLKYLKPTSYFRLKRNDNTFVFPRTEKLNKSVLQNLDKDKNYQSSLAQAYDLSWQAIQKGYIGNAKTYTHFEKLPIEDEYRFIRKNFHKAWVLYVLLLRLVSFKNPIKEIRAYRKTKNAKRQNFASTPIQYPAYNEFKSPLLEEQPLVSVVIPTLNRYAYLKDVLRDLEKQNYSNFEVIVVDQSEPFQKEFYKDFDLNLNLIYQKEKALWLARNTAIRKANGEYILLFDDDSRVEADWIEKHLKSLDFFKADISSGVSISKAGDEVPENYAYFLISSQLDTGNVLLPKQIFKEIGLFDRQFEKMRMGDGEFGLRAYLANYRNISNPLAKRLHLKVGSGGLREMGAWDAFRSAKWFAPKPVPSVLYLYRKYFGKKAAKLALLKNIPPSMIPYRFKKNKKLLPVGLLLALFAFPLVAYQVSKSWKIAGKMLKEGAKIEKL